MRSFKKYLLNEDDEIKASFYIDGLPFYINKDRNINGIYYFFEGQTKNKNNIRISFLSIKNKKDIYEIVTRLNGKLRKVDANPFKNLKSRRETIDEMKSIHNIRTTIIKYFKQNYNPKILYSEPAEKINTESESDFIERFNNNKTVMKNSGFEIKVIGNKIIAQ